MTSKPDDEAVGFELDAILGPEKGEEVLQLTDAQKLEWLA